MVTMPIRGALIDLNGTLHVGRKEIPGAIAALNKLRNSGVRVQFLTNTTKDTRAGLVRLVRDIGFNIREEEVFTSLTAARDLLVARGARPHLLLHPDALPEFAGLDTTQPNAVVVGLAKEAFSYDAMNAAFRVLMADPDATLVAVHKGRYLREEGGALALGPGPYVAALEYATGKTAQVVGKPEAAFFAAALAALNAAHAPAPAAGGALQPGEVVMVGDDVRDDCGGALAAGMRALLVRTGKYLAGDEAKHGITPTATVESFAHAVDWILAHARA